jgi:hypothetical protein
MKNLLLALVAIFWMISCETKSSVDPENNVAAQDPKCLLVTQWGIDFSKPTQYPSSHWMRDPEMYFNTATAGAFSIGIPPKTYKNNPISWFVEIQFNYTLKQNKVIYDVKKVFIYNTFLQQLDAKTGADAIAFAKDFMNLDNLGSGYEFTCTEKSLSLLVRQLKNQYQ